MKRLFWQKGAILAALLWMILGCSVDAPEKPDSRPIPEPVKAELLYLYSSGVSISEIHLTYSVPVKMLSLTANPIMDVSFFEIENTVIVNVNEELKLGYFFTLDYTVKDQHDQIISGAISFYVKGNIINELLIDIAPGGFPGVFPEDELDRGERMQAVIG